MVHQKVKDNVSTEEVVDVIKEYRSKINYNHWDDNASSNVDSWTTKLREVGAIFEKTDHTNEWNKTIIVAVANVVCHVIKNINKEYDDGTLIEQFQERTLFQMIIRPFFSRNTVYIKTLKLI